MKISIKLFGKEASIAVNEPEPDEHRCPTNTEQFEKWKATASSGTHFGFAPTHISDRAMAPAWKRWENG